MRGTLRESDSLRVPLTNLHIANRTRYGENRIGTGGAWPDQAAAACLSISWPRRGSASSTFFLPFGRSFE